MTNYSDALNIINKSLEQLKPDVINLKLEESTGFILAEDILTDTNLPSFDYSTMDGFAIKFDTDIKEWQVIGEITAGNYIDIEVGPGTAVSIMTGGKIPNGADTVIPVENVEISGNMIKLTDSRKHKKGANIRYAAEDMKTNEMAIGKDSVLEPSNITLAAACGKAFVNVYMPFKIGVLSTGDELVDINQVPTGDNIRNSNLYTIVSAIKKFNMVPVSFGSIGDKKELITDKLKEILSSDIDALVTCGGVSVGKHDLLPEVLESVGAERILWKVNIKPGKPFLFSIFKKEDKIIPVFSLPGNPVSCFVNFEVLVKPVLSEIFKKEESNIFPAILDDNLDKKDGKRHFVLGNYTYDKDSRALIVRKAGGQSSGDMVTLSRANCLVVFPEEISSIQSGEVVECIRI